MKIKTQEISSRKIRRKGVRLYMKRIDLIDDIVSGNKWFKLKYNIPKAKNHTSNKILTFGGSYSNHIFSTSYLAYKNNIKSIGVIRGEESLPLNFTLNSAVNYGMCLHYVSREKYSLKSTSIFLNELKEKFGDFYHLPEGGTNELAIEGTTQILDVYDNHYDFICCPLGTGGTFAGLIKSSSKNQRLIGFPAIKGFGNLEEDISSWVDKYNWCLIKNYSYGGYAKINNELVLFIKNFYKKYNIPLDAIYNGKMMIGVMDLIYKGYFARGSTILVINTGGLQGNKGMNDRFLLDLPERL